MICLFFILVSACFADPTNIPTCDEPLDARKNSSWLCSSENDDTCPPGLFCENGECECGVYPHHFISCNGTISKVLRSYCVNFDLAKNLTLVGQCLHNTIDNHDEEDGLQPLYRQLPTDIHQLSSIMCGSLNREGVFCGKCQAGHYPLAYSFNMTCIPCPQTRRNWVRYIMAAYLPLTFFYVGIVLCKVNLISSHLFALVYFCQATSMPFLLRGNFLAILKDTNPYYVEAAKVVLSLYGVWNLDFFRPFYSDLCLGTGELPTLALDYGIAVYPLLLIVISYLLILQFKANNRAITFIWRPFRAFLSFLGKKWDPNKTSVIDAYATFFFLSNIKFLSVSFDLLIPVPVYQLYPDHYNYTLGLYYAGSIHYFDKHHLPYAILAIVMLLCFVILPTILLTIYPLQFFQKCRGPHHKHCVLSTSFYSCYKDGSHNTRDFRCFASVSMWIRLFQFALFIIPDKVIFLTMLTMTVMGHATLVAVFQPFKSSTSHPKLNAVNVLFLQFLTLFCLAIVVVNFAAFMSPQFVLFSSVLAFLFGSLPVFYTVVLTLRWVYSQGKRSSGLCIAQRIAAWKNGQNCTPITHPKDDDLPHRIENSDKYPRKNLSNFMSHLAG